MAKTGEGEEIMKCVPIEVTLLDSCGSDLSVVNAARVSFHKEVAKDATIAEKDVKLINYLAKHKHTSPFNHAFITMRVKAPIFVARQLVKHKFMPWNEVSRRYVDDEPEFYMPTLFRKAADNVKQGSSDEPLNVNEMWTCGYGGPQSLQQMVNDTQEYSLCLYTQALERGMCAEQARMFLPQNTMTEWVWSGTLGAWCDMIRLRIDPHTQYETRIVANQAAAVIEQLFPHSYKALLTMEETV